MLVTVILAVAVPALMAGFGSRLWRTAPVDPGEALEPYRMQIAGLRRTIDDIRDREWRQTEEVDWTRYLAPSLPSPAEDPDAGDTVPAASTIPAVPLFELVLRGTGWIDESRPYANVNDQVLTLGDEIDGFRVAEITKNHVSFVGPDGQIYTSDIDDRLRETYRDHSMP
jgi:hypothetical protein